MVHAFTWAKVMIPVTVQNIPGVLWVIFINFES